MVFWVVLTVAIFFAVVNFQSGKCDVRGCLRLGMLIFFVRFLVCLVEASHAADALFEFTLIDFAVGRALAGGVGFGILYAAIEPTIREHLPHTIVSWSRLLAGDLLDSMVARDALMGSVCSIYFCFVVMLCFTLDPSLVPDGTIPIETRQLLSHLPGAITWAFIGSLFFLTIVMLATLATRRLWGGCVLFALVILVLNYFGNEGMGLKVANTLAIFLGLLLLVRWGMVAHIGFGITSYWIAKSAVDPSLTAWYAQTGLLVLLLVGVWLVFLGWRASSVSSPQGQRLRVQ